MTVLRDFIGEIASELDARTDKPLASLSLDKVPKTTCCR
jgi:hypothetical protein